MQVDLNILDRLKAATKVYFSPILVASKFFIVSFCYFYQECSKFQAASADTSKNRTEKLDVVGMFACVCRHEFPMKVLDMRLPER